MLVNDHLQIAEIIKGCCKGDRVKQNALYKLYYAYGMSVCMRYVRNESEGTTILNEAFLKVFNNIHKFDSSLPFKPWFRRILINTALNHLRKEKKYKVEIALDHSEYISDQEQILSHLNYKEILKLVQSLTTAYRTVFNLYVIEGYKHDEIAKLLGISVGTSKSNLSRARMKLQELVLTKINNPYV